MLLDKYVNMGVLLNLNALIKHNFIEVPKFPKIVNNSS